VYGWPADDAVRQAVGAVRESDAGIPRVLFVAFDARMASLLRGEVG
jgi:hypothetical protein